MVLLHHFSGVVRLGIHSQTKKKVAVKIVDKNKIQPNVLAKVCSTLILDTSLILTCCTNKLCLIPSLILQKMHFLQFETFIVQCSLFLNFQSQELKHQVLLRNVTDFVQSSFLTLYHDFNNKDI